MEKVDQEKNSAQVKAMKDYVYAMVQATQWLIAHRKVGLP